MAPAQTDDWVALGISGAAFLVMFYLTGAVSMLSAERIARREDTTWSWSSQVARSAFWPADACRVLASWFQPSGRRKSGHENKAG